MRADFDAVDFDALAAEMLTTKAGVGMVPPFYAETASAKGDPDFPTWIVRNKTCNSLGWLISRRAAEKLAAAMNAAVS